MTPPQRDGGERSFVLAPEVARVLTAAMDRIVPADEWPSASAADVGDYLEHQSGRDHASLWADLLLDGLRTLDIEADQRHRSSFAALSTAAQDRLLDDISADRTQVAWPVSAPAFFASLVRVVIEGYYTNRGNDGSGADDNRQRQSWDMIGYRASPRRPTASSESPPPASRRLDDVRGSYDAVVVGAGAGGGVAACILAESGLSVLLVERERWLRSADIPDDHLRNHRLPFYGHNTGPAEEGHPRVLVSRRGGERIMAPHELGYHNNAMTVGGGTRVYGAQAWRYPSGDFRAASCGCLGLGRSHRGLRLTHPAQHPSGPGSDSGPPMELSSGARVARRMPGRWRDPVSRGDCRLGRLVS